MVTAGQDQVGSTDFEWADSTFHADGEETGSDTGFSLDAGLTDSGYDNSTDETGDVVTALSGYGGTVTGGEDVQYSGEERGREPLFKAPDLLCRKPRFPIRPGS